MFFAGGSVFPMFFCRFRTVSLTFRYSKCLRPGQSQMLLVYIINSKGTVRPLFPRINVIALVVSLRFLLQTSARNQQEPHVFGYPFMIQAPILMGLDTCVQGR